MITKKIPEFHDIVSRDGLLMGSAEYRMMLDCVHPKCYIESDSTDQTGEVVEIYRDKKGIPVCFKIVDGLGEQDYISVDRVTFFEPYNYYNPIENYDIESNEALENSLLADGYVWDDERGSFYNKETGDEVVW